MDNNQAITKDRIIKISRLLNAPVELVWEVWTNPEHIKNWWGPTDFTTTIQSMNLQKDGEWLLIMHGPDGTDYHNKSIFTEIIKHKKLVYEHVSTPRFTATIDFEAMEKQTMMHWKMEFETAEQLIQVVKTFKADEGLKQNTEKLIAYLEANLFIHQQLKTTKMSRVSTYLNFPGNTEEAMTFYTRVFQTDFVGGNIQRFGDIPAQEGMPPLSETDKKLVLHAEIQILGGHIIMATDAPASMGFTVSQGNNIHINLEPDTRKETKRLFESLSDGGKVTMPLEDMFWGAYYGSCTDRYGINWMFNCTEA